MRIGPLASARRTALAIGAILFVALAWYEATHQARLQQPKLFPDSIVYLQTADQPLAIDHLFYPKPIAVPALYHALCANPVAIADFQLRFAIIAWITFGLVLCAALHRWRARVAAVAITFLFLLAPYRIGFASAILSESIADSLATLAVAGGLALAVVARLPGGRARTLACWGVMACLACTTAAWILTRDSNAISALAATAIAGVLWRLHRSWREAPWAVVLVAVVGLTSGFAMWTSRVAPAAPTNLALHASWTPDFLPRTAFPMLNNIVLRILPDAQARQFFAARGMPDADKLATVDWDAHDARLFTDPDLAAVRVWIAEHGSSVYMRWLFAHPLDRADELAGHLWDVLAPTELAMYMPAGWISSYGFPGWTVRRGTSSELLLLVLVLAVPFALRRPTGHVTMAVAAILIGSGVLGAAAAYYGDALEVVRHMFGAGQQIVLGLFLAPLAWLDRKPS